MTYGFSLKIPGWPNRSPPQGEDNDKASGGLPHSEITGSKPIPGSPVLIAGYHVLHRLLLPRHPPNALLALDPIQRRTGVQSAQTAQIKEAPFCITPHPSHAQSPSARAPWSEVIHFPAPWPGKATGLSVSVLDLEQNRLRATQSCAPQVTPTLGGTSGSDVSLSSRCKLVAQLDG